MMLSVVNYFVKLTCYTFCGGKLKNILKEAEKDMFHPTDAKSKEIMTRTMRIWRIIFRFYMTTCISVVSLWAACAFITNNDIALPFGYWYPFDVSSSPVYEIVFFFEVIGILLMVISHVTLDVSVAGIMAFIIGQINILNDNLRNINSKDEIAVNTQIRCFILHRNIKRLVTKLNEMLMFPMFIQSTMGAAILCTAMYKLSKVPFLSGQGLSYIAYYVAMITQLSLHFWYGNEVIAKVRLNIIYSVE
ncbi:7tm Odorant receptor [Popillia japonica]|uniref:7tm Odorant receptor n=1 Tax=Popillia japonica TaxID=7064 RepID=A0AAW1MMD0_POPJA